MQDFLHLYPFSLIKRKFRSFFLCSSCSFIFFKL